MHKAAKRWQIAQEAENEGWQSWKALRTQHRNQLEDYWRWYIALISGYVAFRPEHRILDIGCGPDGVINYIPAGERFGLDPLMDSYLASFEMPRNINWQTGTMEHIPFGDGYFDVVITTNTIDHALQPQKGLGEMHRVLKSRGHLVLTVNCYAPLRRLLRILKERLGRGDKAHPHNYSRRQVRTLLTEAGFPLLAEQKGIGTMGVWFWEVPAESQAGIVNKIANPIFWLEDKLFGHSCIDFVFVAQKGES